MHTGTSHTSVRPIRSLPGLSPHKVWSHSHGERPPLPGPHFHSSQVFGESLEPIFVGVVK